MKRITALFVAALVIACGAVDSESDQNNGPPGIPGGGKSVPISGTFLTAGSSTTARVVVKTTREGSVPVLDEEGIRFGCTTTAQCLDPAYAGTGTCVGGFCEVPTIQTLEFYRQTYPVAGNGSVSFPVPCDGFTYAADVFGANAVGGAQRIAEAVRTLDIVVSTACAVNTPSWNPITLPALNVSDVYVAMPGHSTFAVSTNGYASPWASSLIMANGVVRNGAFVTFPSPTLDAQIVVSATYGLEGDASSWVAYAETTIDPINVATVTQN